jgi:magnesium-transporting ATPase (P-type)
VIKGRETFGNIIKYLNMTASSNFGNVFSVLVASAFIPFLPMLAIHLLIQNLMYDLSQLSLPWDKMDKEFLRKPRKWDAKNIGRFMLWIGPTSSIFDITTFALMWYVFAANNVEAQALFQSGWFIEGLLSQTLVVHMLRTQKIPFIQSRATLPVLLTTVIMAIGIYIPFSPLGAMVGLEPLPELLPVAGRDAAQLLSGGAGHEEFLYQTFRSVVLMIRSRRDESFSGHHHCADLFPDGFAGAAAGNLANPVLKRARCVEDRWIKSLFRWRLLRPSLFC